MNDIATAFLSRLQDIAVGLQDHGDLAYYLLFLVILTETVVLAGAFLPGTMFLSFMGFLCYLGIYDPWLMFTAAFLAHYLGEWINYGIGRRYGRDLFKEESRFFRPAFLATAEDQIAKGGSLIVITGQFLGPLRPFVTLALGIANYSVPRFAFQIAIGGGLWVALPFLMGLVFGAGYQRAQHHIQGMMLGVVLALPLLFLAGWAVKEAVGHAGWFVRFAELLIRLGRRSPAWQALRRYFPRTISFVETRLSPTAHYGLGTTLCFLVSAAAITAFFLLARMDMTGRPHSDLAIVALLAQLRDPYADIVFLFSTQLACTPAILALLAVSCAWCAMRRQWKGLVTMLASAGLATLSANVSKWLTEIPRPSADLHAVTVLGSAFPSIHATLAAATFGALYTYLWNHPGRSGVRAYLLTLAAVCVIMVGFSRLYLGVHYPTDVMAGWLLGGTIALSVSAVISQTRRLTDNARPADPGGAAAILAACLVAACTMATAPRVQGTRPQDHPMAVPHPLPTEALTVSGRPYTPINLVVRGPFDGIQRWLQTTGWHSVKPVDFFVRRFASPVSPCFVDGRPPDETWKHSETTGTRLILRCWRLGPDKDGMPVTLVSLRDETATERFFGDTYRPAPDVDATLDRFVSHLPASGWNVRPVEGFRPRGLYLWSYPFFTHGRAFEITLPMGTHP